MPAAPSRSPIRSAAPSRTARPLMGSGRPVKIDLTGIAMGGGGESQFSTEPLASFPAWGAAPTQQHTPTSTLPLSDMVDRASAQVLILRKTIDEAAAADRAVRQHAAELAQRLTQGQGFAHEFDQRLARAGQAASVVDRAAAALTALDALVQQIRGAQDAVLKTFDSKLAQQQRDMASRMEDQQRELAERLEDQQREMEGRLTRQEAEYDARMARQEEIFERRIHDLAETFENSIARVERTAISTREESERLITENRRSLMQQVENLCAAADRHVAQTQARASLINDGVSDRVETLHQQCERIGQTAQERLDELTAKAAAVLGHDPRSPYAEIQPGSLADAAQKAGSIIAGVDNAAIRIAAIRNDAETTLTCLMNATNEARRIASEYSTRIESLQRTIDAAQTAVAEQGDQARNKKASDELRRASSK